MNWPGYFGFLMFVISSIIFNGNPKAQDFNGGMQLGLSTSEISGDRINGPSKVGLYAGVFVNHSISNYLSLQLELNFVQKGSNKNPDSISLDNYILRLNYLEIPLLFIINLHKHISFEAGPSFGYLIKKYEEADYQELEIPFKNWDVGISIGLYYVITKKWKFNIRYFNTIFFSVREHASGTTYWLNRGQYNEVLSFTFHYQFKNL
ncbi:porin family protein [Bacteroidota bacterium]